MFVPVLVVLGTLLLTVVADRVVGLLIEKPVAAGLIFPPGSSLTYRTPEFKDRALRCFPRAARVPAGEKEQHAEG
jgi:hypothetical protein